MSIGPRDASLQVHAMNGTARWSGRIGARLAAMLLSLALAALPAAANAADSPLKMADREVVYGLTVMQLGTAAAIGGWLGGSAALATRRASVGAGLGLLATIYVAHLAVEALVVGGVYFFWPGDAPPEDAGTTPTGDGPNPRISGLELANGSRHATP
jgi:hypothetical protein